MVGRGGTEAGLAEALKEGWRERRLEGGKVWWLARAGTFDQSIGGLSVFSAARR